MNPPRILKWTVPVNDEDYELELRGPVVHVGSQRHRSVQVWAVEDETVEPVLHTFRVVATGQYLPDGAEHVGTATDGPFVWHLVRVPQES